MPRALKTAEESHFGPLNHQKRQSIMIEKEIPEFVVSSTHQGLPDHTWLGPSQNPPTSVFW